MANYKWSRLSAIEKYKVWKNAKVEAEQEVAAAREQGRLAKDKADKEADLTRLKEEKLQDQIRKMEAEIVCVGNPEQDVTNLLKSDVTVDGLSR